MLFEKSNSSFYMSISSLTNLELLLVEFGESFSLDTGISGQKLDYSKTDHIHLN